MTGATMGALRWTRRNLFASPLNGALTIACLLLIVLAVPPALTWLVLDANFAGTSRADCTGGGAWSSSANGASAGSTVSEPTYRSVK